MLNDRANSLLDSVTENSSKSFLISGLLGAVLVAKSDRCRQEEPVKTPLFMHLRSSSLSAAQKHLNAWGGRLLFWPDYCLPPPALVLEGALEQSW